ncbi:helix-turn-helix domain-containing protein [Paenibacillus macerans]|uniref:helix-turn-helix domain-containing protein n=1 Tax=Paenibacillus macerans TaxID=44252 RepID=UPI003D317964
MDVAKQVGKNVRYYRKLKGLTQEQLAESTETYGSYIGRLERGEQNVQLETLHRIADALQVSVYALFRTPGFDQLNDQTRIWQIVQLLQEQSAEEQARAYRVLKEMFRQK